jgi:ABC-type cobalamin/Fe3+-siderophores transport system ATPase subunit
MKLAKLKDKWRNVEDVERYINGISSISQNLDPDNPGSRTSTFDFIGINAIVGNNGAGKSSFFEFLTNPDYSKISFRTHEILLENGNLIEIPKQSLEALIVDPFSQLKESNVNLSVLKSTIDSEGTYYAKDKELDLINYVLSSRFSEIGFTEIEISDEKKCPYFQVKLDASCYDNDNLSQGEQLVLFTFWALKIQNKNVPVIFLEEPEAGLSPATQIRLLEMLVSISSDEKKQIFISTHSPFIVQNLGRSRVILLKKEEKAIWYKIKNEEYLEELGMALGKTHLFIVEDHKAKIFLERILDIYGSQMRRKSDILFVGGESNVYAVMTRIDTAVIDFSILGVLDGDIKGQQKYDKLLQEGRSIFLPGKRAPEVEIIESIKAKKQEYASLIGVNNRLLSDCMRRLKGVDHHDYFEELSKGLFKEIKLSVYEAAFKIWFENFQNRAEIEEFIKVIDPSLDAEDFEEVRKQYPLKD